MTVKLQELVDICNDKLRVPTYPMNPRNPNSMRMDSAEYLGVLGRRHIPSVDAVCTELGVDLCPTSSRRLFIIDETGSDGLKPVAATCSNCGVMHLGDKFGTNFTNTECRECANLRGHKRRTILRGLTSDFTAEQRAEVLRYFNNSCALTGEPFTDGNLSLDHVIPVVTGHGGTTHGNIVPILRNLNCSKNDSNVFEWFSVAKERHNLKQDRFDALIEYVAGLNGMSADEYREYVYECHADRK
jgi:hypothetical protein